MSQRSFLAEKQILEKCTQSLFAWSGPFSMRTSVCLHLHHKIRILNSQKTARLEQILDSTGKPRPLLKFGVSHATSFKRDWNGETYQSSVEVKAIQVHLCDGKTETSAWASLCYKLYFVHLFFRKAQAPCLTNFVCFLVCAVQLASLAAEQESLLDLRDERQKEFNQCMELQVFQRDTEHTHGWMGKQEVSPTDWEERRGWLCLPSQHCWKASFVWCLRSGPAGQRIDFGESEARGIKTAYAHTCDTLKCEMGKTWLPWMFVLRWHKHNLFWGGTSGFVDVKVQGSVQPTATPLMLQFFLLPDRQAKIVLCKQNKSLCMLLLCHIQ